MWGCAQQRSEQRTNIARQIALFSDLGESVPATTIDRQCASSAQAIISAADSIAAGRHDAVIAGGVESMSRVKMGGGDSGDMYPKLEEEYGMRNLQMGMTAEKVAEEFDISARNRTSTVRAASSARSKRPRKARSTTKSFPSRPTTAFTTRTRAPPRDDAGNARRASDSVQRGRDGHAR